MRRAVGDALHEPLLDLRQRALRDEQIGVRAAQQSIDDRIDDQRADLQAELPIQLLCVEQVETRRVRQRVNELAVRKLLNTGDGYFDDRAKIAGECHAEIAPETLM